MSHDTIVTDRRMMQVGKGWVQGVVMVMLFSFTVMGILVYRTYTASMPVPDVVQTSSGERLFTSADITQGQELFQARGLMEYGSIMGHGAYLGPDFTADYLRRATDITADLQRQSGIQDPTEQNVKDWRTNRFTDGTLTFSPNQVTAYQQLISHYSDFFGKDARSNGLLENGITDPTQIKQLTSFFAWTAWASAADRPGHDYSYTNNWPAEKRVDNGPTADLLLWSALSLVVLIGGTGVLFAIYGRWSRKIGWHSEEAPAIAFRQPGEVGLTKSQRTVAWFIFVIALLFLVQTLVGALAEHYRADIGSFFGLDFINELLPYNLARTWHLQLSLFWTAAGFLAAGIFLTPFISGREAKNQHVLSYILLGAVAVVVFGSLAAEALSIHGVSWADGPLFGQQWEYLDLPRVFQVLLTAGMFIWIAIVYRGIRSRLKGESKGNMPWLFFFSALAIPAFYAVGLLASTDSHLSVAEFWRFWVVHLWVEDFLELFTTVMVAYIFVMLGVVRERIAIGIIFMDIILYSMGGVLGTMHHLYFSGTPVEHMALGSFFSAAEVIPLTFLTVEAWAFMQLGARQEAKSSAPFPHRWTVMFLVAVGFWNFVGAGIFGFLINLPIVSYYEIGTALTANHGHAAMMGVYGMLAVGLSMFALRYLIPADQWNDKLAKISFWSLNIGLAWMVFATLLPLGILQLYHAVGSGYYEARELNYVTNSTNTLLEWGRLPGDLIFIIGGVLPFLWLAWKGLLSYRSGRTVDQMPQDVLFTELESSGAKKW
ncbi:cbb3-type cytochrome c oxidase subunit I [Arsenicicoccus piscis]|uniref:Nitric oxide reductase n=1 Tax=Arsenicicoccus piscis TaxID=673954 RepID=A0ABQ6HMS1_9MICO|nr:cbb3-type cytochrome c oxidase subunit I [Arsenicicoccus piscis]MCH8628639.1 cbb3-type cytochrome c oxidase subunit I [Arsenicicoccus piscis]GMA19430.1 nitric oxide reductase [Arsenicicoccus piscis]